MLGKITCLVIKFHRFERLIGKVGKTWVMLGQITCLVIKVEHFQRLGGNLGKKTCLLTLPKPHITQEPVFNRKRQVKDRLPRVISEKTCLFVYFIKDMSLTCLLGD